MRGTPYFFHDDLYLLVFLSILVFRFLSDVFHDLLFYLRLVVDVSCVHTPTVYLYPDP